MHQHLRAVVATGVTALILVTGMGAATATPHSGKPAKHVTTSTTSSTLFVAPTVATSTVGHGSPLAACVHARNAARKAAHREALAKRKAAHHGTHASRVAARDAYKVAHRAAVAASKTAMQACLVAFKPPVVSTSTVH